MLCFTVLKEPHTTSIYTNDKSSELSTFTSSNFSVAEFHMEPKQNTQYTVQGIHMDIPLSQ